MPQQKDAERSRLHAEQRTQQQVEQTDAGTEEEDPAQAEEQPADFGVRPPIHADFGVRPQWRPEPPQCPDGKTQHQTQRGKKWSTKRGEKELSPLDLSPSAQVLRDDALLLLEVLNEQIKRLDDLLWKMWGKDPRVLRLMTISGVGRLTAIALVVELGEIDRFPDAKHLASYLGLAPVVRASGEHLWVGRISKEGNRFLRWLLVCAAAKAIRRPGPLRTWGRALLVKKGKKVAYTAVAVGWPALSIICGRRRSTT